MRCGLRLPLLFCLGLCFSGCGAGAPTFAGCADDLDCAVEADTCHRLLFDRTDGTPAAGNLCTHSCGSDADCGPGASCISLAGDPESRFFCAAECAAASDCYADFACTRIDAMALSLCLP